MLFKSDLQHIADLSTLAGADVRSLPQLFRCDREFALKLNCPELNSVLEALPKHPEYRYLRSIAEHTC